MSSTATLVWFRKDLRLADHPALQAALQAGGPVIPIFIWSPEEEGTWQPASASRWWLHQSLKALGEELAKLGSRLILRRGPTTQTLLDLARQTGAKQILWCRRYEPAVIDRDKRIKSELREQKLQVESFNASLLFEPWVIQNKQAKPYGVYTPFWKACCAAEPPSRPLARPNHLPAPHDWPDSLALNELQLEPTIDWAKGMRETWTPGEREAEERLRRFLAQRLTEYAELRDRPDLEGTSALSPHLHFGEISPRTIWYRVLEHLGKESVNERLSHGAEIYLKELVWREFAYHLLYHFPRTTDEPLRPEFAAFPWQEDRIALRAWQRGRTGYPLVDAGMRQLWSTGWMHNRVRMVVASFLVKHLLIPWQQGARWFWDTLVDADLASNTLGWQWTAGCGADAAPYFRIFNPVSQGEKFDPEGEYVRRWVPELSRLPATVIHQPWKASPKELEQAGLSLGENYPLPIVDHTFARNRALKALATISKSNGSSR